ncbi:MAG: response regulator transcription factor, partial [Elusimicrobiota bacterium]
MLRRLLICGPERKDSLALVSGLPKTEFIVRVETSPVASLQAAKGWQPEAVILQTDHSSRTCLDLCRGLKAEEGTRRIPVMLVSDGRDQRHVNESFESGADDFMTKPCHPTELLWRVRNLIRRYQAPSSAPSEVSVGPICLNPEQGTASLDNKALELTKKEFLVLELFLRHPDRLLS